MTKQQQLTEEQAVFFEAMKQYVDKKTHPPVWYLPIIITVVLGLLGFFLNDFYRERKEADKQASNEIIKLEQRLLLINLQLENIQSLQQDQKIEKKEMLIRINTNEDEIIDMRGKIYELQKIHGIAR